MDTKEAKIRAIVHKIFYYRDVLIYIRQIGREYFEYLDIIDGKVFSNYVIMKPATGKEKLTKAQVVKTVGLIMAGATATVDTYLENKKQGEENARAN
jgi:hypothetical protein